MFPGKPVKTKRGDGFVLGKKPESEDEFYVKIGGDLVSILRDDIYCDPDQNDSMLDETEKL